MVVYYKIVNFRFYRSKLKPWLLLTSALFAHVIMDKKIEKSNKDKILRRVAKELKEFDFSRAKTAFFVREIGPIIEFVSEISNPWFKN